MAQHVFKRWSRLLICLGLSGFGTVAAAEGVSIRQLGADQLRLASVAYRLAAANAAGCSNPQMQTGLILHDLSQYRPEVRPAIATAFSLHGGVGVLQLVPDSAAARAGFAIDDEIVAVNGEGIVDSAAVAQPGQSADRIERIAQRFAEALSAGPADFLVRRRGALRLLRLNGQPGCGGTPFLVPSPELNAWSDGRRIFVSSAMLRVAGDDDALAFVVAHEMAHNMLGHSSSSANRGLLGLFGFGASRIRGEEREADGYAVSMVEHGGYRPAAAVAILASLGNRLWWNLSLDHPGFGERIRIVRAAIERSGQAEFALAAPTPSQRSPR